MINLLPSQQKKEIKEIKIRNLIFIWEFFLICFLIFISFSILIVRIFVWSEIDIAKIDLAEREKEIALFEYFEKKAESFNSLVSEIYSFYQTQRKFTTILEEISQTIPQGIVLYNLKFSIPGKKQDPLSVFLSGFAPNRELLLSFKENLENRQNFFEIYFPLEGWISQENINFTVQFKIK